MAVWEVKGEGGVLRAGAEEEDFSATGESEPGSGQVAM